MAFWTYLKASLSITVLLVAMSSATAAGETIHIIPPEGPYASCLFPPDGEVIPGAEYVDNIYTWLDFIPGVGADSHEAFFNDDPAQVYARDPNVSLGAPPYQTSPHRYYVGLPLVGPYTQSLVQGTTYYWCVDETDANGTVWQGPVWRFSISSEKAWDPNPRDGQKSVSITPILSWKAGIGAQWHVIYFGTNFDDVNDDIVRPLVPPPLSYQGYQPIGDEDWDPIVDGGHTIEFETTYYWRVDEGHMELPPPIGGGVVVKGDVWSFTTEVGPIFVDIDAAGANDGTSWENAYKYLQYALGAAGSAVKPVEIRVAQGIYTPSQGVVAIPDFNWRTTTFQLINGVTIKGGYAGFGEPNPNARDIELYETILSGDLNGNDIEVNDPCDLLNEPTRAENSYHVVTGSGTEQNAVLDGFTITAGNANEKGFQNRERIGAGMYNESGRPALVNCTFSGNSAAWYGGGMFNSKIYFNPTLTNCTFSRNYAGRSGGGIYNNSSSPTLNNCTFSGNASAGYGGGMSVSQADSILNNCTFSGNSAIYGAGIDIVLGATSLTNCKFISNQADYGGVIFTGETCLGTLTNCTFAANLAISGNALACNGIGSWGPAPSGFRFNNCIFWDGGDEIWNNDGSTIIITYSDIQGGWPGLGNIDADPCFADTNNDDYHLKSQVGRWEPNSESWVTDGVTSPCIDAGNPGCPLGDEPAPNGNRRNMGAYGGTAEASKSPTYWRSIADLTNDWIVDNNDLKVFAGYWLEAGECVPGDLNRSQFVDFNDFAIFGGQWREKGPGPGITYEVDECIPWEPGSSVAEEPNQTRFSVRVEGNKIFFEDLITANCCAWIELQMTMEDNLITIYEIEHLEGVPCPCICDYPVSATLGPFEDGNYIVEVIGINGSSLGFVEVTIGEPGITYEVDKCIPMDFGSFVAEEPNQTRFSVWVEGNNIHFEDLITANCCADRIELQMTVEDNLITIYEIEHLTHPCYCICDYPTTATLGPFEDGIYLVEVIGINGTSLGFVEVTIGEPGITYQIKDCDREASGLLAATEPGQTRFTVTVEGNNIHFEDMMYANCCPDELEVQMLVEDNLITIYEIEHTSEGCRCMCTFPVTATLGPFEPGLYVLEVYEDGVFIGSTTVTIEPNN